MKRITMILCIMLIFQVVPVRGSWEIIREPRWGTAFRDVKLVDRNNGWAVGLFGVIAHTSDGGYNWERQNVSSEYDLYGVDFVDIQNGWIVGSRGVILHTGNGGSEWHVQLQLNLGGEFVSLYDVDFVDVNTGWAVGEGVILHTSNGGATWLTQYTCSSVLEAVCAVDPQNVWVVGRDGVILHTSDGGQSWQTQTSGVDKALKDVDFVDLNNGWVVGDSGIILHTSDGGNTWIPQTSEVWDWIAAVDFVDSQTGWIVCPFGEPNCGIYYTNDGGTTWTPQFTKWGIFNLNFTDNENGWAVGLSGTIYITSDGGSNWKRVSSDFGRFSGVDFVNPKNGWTSGWGNGSSTKNWGATWQIIFPWGSDVDFVDEKHGWVAGERGIWYTEDGGKTWEMPQDITYMMGVCFLDLNEGWAVGRNGTIVHTEDGGKTWQVQQSGTSFNLDCIFFIDHQIGWAVGANGTILHTNDGGETWIQQDSGTDAGLHDVYFLNPDEGWCVGRDGTILHTADGGETWSPQVSGVDHTLRGVIFVNESEGWVVGGHGFDEGEGVILHTTDGGATWSIQFTHPVYTLHDICYDGDMSLYAVGGHGAILKYVDPNLSARPGTEISGSLSGTLTLDDSPYIVTGDISVPDGQTLEIEPGVVIRFNGKFQFDVYGTLRAIGTEERPIVFTSNKAAPHPGDWRTINLINSENTVIQNCLIEYASGSETGEMYYGAISCDNSNPEIYNNVIRNNERWGIVCHDNSNPIISGNIITDNGWAGIKIHNNSSPKVENNIIRGNADGGEGGAGIIFNSGGMPSIVNNLIYDNSGAGILAHASTTSHDITNNTIYGNTEGISIGEAEITVRNCIIWGNGVGIRVRFANQEPSVLQVLYSDVQGGWEGEGNIDKDPLFVHPEKGDFYLSDFSPCIGAGTKDGAPSSDIEGNARGIPPDIGAYENPRDIPRLIGDVSGNGAITAYDASLILRYVVGLIEEFPTNLPGSPPAVNPHHYIVRVPEMSARVGEQICIPVTVDDATGLLYGGISLKYDERILRAVEALPGSTLNGSYWSANTELEGEVRFAFARAEPVKGGGALLTMRFEVLPGAEGRVSPLVISDVGLSNSLSITKITGSVRIVPSVSALLQNYPNPFNPETWIPFQLAEDADVKIFIYDISGRPIKIFDLGYLRAGYYTTKATAVRWDGRNEHGERVASGVYIYQMKVGRRAFTRRMVILK